MISRQETLELDHWMFDLIHPYIHGRILELASSRVNIHDLFIEEGLQLHLSDINEESCQILSNKYSNNEIVRNVHKINLDLPNFDHTYAHLQEAFGTIVSLTMNMDLFIRQQNINNINYLLRGRGHLFFLLTANVVSYPGTDRDLDDLKLKSQPFINSFLGDQFEILKTRYMDIPKITSLGQTSQCPTLIVIAEKK